MADAGELSTKQPTYVAVEYSGLPDPETKEGRVWHSGRYQYLPEVLARRLTECDRRYRMLTFPPPTYAVPGNRALSP